jgi:hypothetical protein
MHDLESFFWVLFWICIRCDGAGEGKVVAQFDRWNYADTEELARLKKGEISDEGDFIKVVGQAARAHALVQGRTSAGIIQSIRRRTKGLKSLHRQPSGPSNKQNPETQSSEARPMPMEGKEEKRTKETEYKRKKAVWPSFRVHLHSHPPPPPSPPHELVA